MSHWTSIADALPEEGDTVLLANTAWQWPVATGSLEDGVWLDEWQDRLDGTMGEEAPTHWMALPEPPDPAPPRKAVITITEEDDSSINVALEFFPAALVNEPTTPSIAAALAAMDAIAVAAKGEEIE